MPGKWHNEWEDNFPINTKEITYVQRIGGVEMSHRRCDAKLNGKIILEFQNSSIKKKEVDSRKKEWIDFGKDILWLINGDDDTIIDRDDNRFIIESKKRWKFDSFNSYKHILYDIQNKVFLLSPKNFKSNQIYGEHYMDKKECILYFKNIQNTPINIETIFNKFKHDKEEIKPSIKKKQQGAGNGKTFQIWKDICENINQKQFILVTKENSAVDTLKEEFVDQWERGEQHISFNLENISFSQDKYCKKWIIKYSNKNTKRQVIVIIGTIDSLLWSWRKNNDKRKNNSNPWKQNVIDIYKIGVDKLTKTGGFNYAGQYLKLNKEMKIYVDESQDLEMVYFNALVRTQDKYGFDMGFSGDKMQSVQGDINLFTKNIKDLNGFNDISIIETKPSNYNRRIKVKNMANEINKIIKFEKYGCPEISTREDDLTDRGKGETVFKIVSWTALVKNEKNKNAIKLWVDDILKHVRKQVLTYDYQPQSFLFEFPILKGRDEIKELESSLQEFWIKMFNDEDYRKTLPEDSHWAKNNHITTKKYTEYVKFHKSENGESIKLSESIYKSRITSIRTAKGMGRDVVFIFNITEMALKQLSNQLINLQYESYLHVAITRAKCQQFFYLTPNGDDIHQRFFDNVDALPYMPNISTFINIAKLKNYMDVNKMVSLINIDEIKIDDNGGTPSVEWEHHCIRYTVYLMILIFAALDLEKSSNDYCDHAKQIETMVKKICQKSIEKMDVASYWKYLRDNSNFYEKNVTDMVFPVMEINKNPIYKQHMNSIIEKIKFVKHNLMYGNLLKNSNLKPFHLVCLSHMLGISRNYHKAEPSINELYQLMDLYNNNDENAEINKNHYEKLMDINNIIQKIIKSLDGKNITWNILHKVKYFNVKSDLSIQTKGLPLIGFNENSVIHFVLKTKFDEADKYGVIIDILLERFLISHQQKIPIPKLKGLKKITTGNKNFERYHKKQVITYLIVLNSGKFHIFKEDDLKINDNLEFKKELKKGIENFFEQKHKELYHYTKYYIYNWKNLKKEADKKLEERDKLTDDEKEEDELNLIALSDTPYELMKLKFKKKLFSPDYITNFFDNLHNRWMDATEDNDEEKINEIRNICNDDNNFIEALNKILNKHLDKFFYMNKKKKKNYNF